MQEPGEKLQTKKVNVWNKWFAHFFLHSSEYNAQTLVVFFCWQIHVIFSFYAERKIETWQKSNKQKKSLVFRTKKNLEQSEVNLAGDFNGS